MSLPTLYQMNFALMYHHKWSLTDMNDLYPFERDIYTGLLEAALKGEESEAPTFDQL